MNCSQARDHLPALLYGDLDPALATLVEAHVRQCSACNQELTDLQEVRQLLDSVPVPKTEVDLSAIYLQSAERQGQKLKRWRRAALAMTAVAALALLAARLPLEVRFQKQQVTLRWGTQVPDEKTAQPGNNRPPAPAPPLLADMEQLRIQRELIQAMLRDAALRDQQRNEEFARLTALLVRLQRQADQRWSQTEQNVAALYLLNRKGNQP